MSITREDVIGWLDNPVTIGLSNSIKLQRDLMEDKAFNATLANYTNNCLEKRSREELFAYVSLEALNNILSNTFYPLYERLKELQKNEIDTEMEAKDSIEEFILNINEALKYAQRK